MWKTILRRVLLMLPQILILSLLAFLIAKMMPGDPFTGLITPETDPNTIPTFVFALILLWLFGYTLGWFPTRGSVDSGVSPGSIGYLINRFHHLLLPALTMAILSTTGTVQYLRTGVIDAKSQDYVRTARAKGVPEKVVFNRHIFRNSILPIAAFLGYEFTGLIGGSVFIENIFSYPGMGNLFVSSISSRDYSVILALLLLFGTATLLGTLLSDIIMSIVDPRVRVQ